ncbi:hypothetical protein [Actinophytocola xanthii]|uniref:Uncharacterized protein n=1 Tax=Actinophytocola xanthii TaxID=1912961 RepID=A0A1Q8CQT9_9PSEU|nr:hypothetical protein [Actinophytocola xanthii]OLF16713.1 hypothetical protein BU204_14640 [Actinophytocola xanthii]
MSEYQYYEFLAVDRPLDEHALAEVRSLSTRARITATSFVNEYHWGDFRGNPSTMMERYYDAHLYLASWGTRHVMLRLPRSVLDLDVAEQYCVGDHVTAWTAGKHVILRLASEEEEDSWDYEPQGSLAAIVGARGELAAGDYRALYLAWLAGYSMVEHDEDEDELEPPVPAGLRTLTASQRALADFLRLDDDLLATAAEASPSLGKATDDSKRLAAWVAALSTVEKDQLLVRVAQDHAATVRLEMLRRFRDETPRPVADQPRRAVADLLDGAARRRADRQRREAVRRADEQARDEASRALARERRLDELASDEEAAWTRVAELIATRRPGQYDEAVRLLADLQGLAERDDRSPEFDRRCGAIRREHVRKTTLVGKLDRANL